MIFCIVGCGNREVEIDGVTYDLDSAKGEFYYVDYIGPGENSILYIPDEINGLPVQKVGHNAVIGGIHGKIYGREKVYFPWSITYSPIGRLEYSSEVQYIISASTSTLIDDHYYITFVVPNLLYNEYIIKTFNAQDNIIPANISYMFNYTEAPNNGYYFVDLVEETGKLTKPPYEPKRDGYKFVGWYKEAECTNQWNFETDTVTIGFDEEGNRIYEEIKLYAKWVKHWTIPAKPNVFR